MYVHTICNVYDTQCMYIHIHMIRYVCTYYCNVHIVCTLSMYILYVMYMPCIHYMVRCVYIILNTYVYIYICIGLQVLCIFARLHILNTSGIYAHHLY